MGRRVNIYLTTSQNPNLLVEIMGTLETILQNFIAWCKENNIIADEAALYTEYQSVYGHLAKKTLAQVKWQEWGMEFNGLGLNVKMGSSSADVMVSDNTSGGTMKDLRNVVQWLPEEYRFLCGSRW